MTTVINFKTEEKTKKAAQQTANELGLSLSAVINAYLKQFVRNKTLFVSSRYESPSTLLLSAIKEARSELKNKKIKSFKTKKAALDYLDKI